MEMNKEKHWGKPITPPKAWQYGLHVLAFEYAGSCRLLNEQVQRLNLCATFEMNSPSRHSRRKWDAAACWFLLFLAFAVVACSF